VQFGLKFETATGEEAEATDGNAKPLPPAPAPETPAAEVAQPAPTLKVVENGDGEKQPGSADVVRLDRFRKK
jgi:hypothetical protein